MNKKEFVKFFASKMGKILITAISALIIYGIMMLILSKKATVPLLILFVVCAIFGWEVLHRLIPVTKSWFTLLYKLLFSIAIGAFVAPFRLGSRVANAAMNFINKIESKKNENG